MIVQWHFLSDVILGQTRNFNGLAFPSLKTKKISAVIDQIVARFNGFQITGRDAANQAVGGIVILGIFHKLNLVFQCKEFDLVDGIPHPFFDRSRFLVAKTQVKNEFPGAGASLR